MLLLLVFLKALFATCWSLCKGEGDDCEWSFLWPLLKSVAAQAALVVGGCLQDIVKSLRAADEAVREAAVRCLYNLSHEATEGVQQQIMGMLEWRLMTELTRDANGTIQVQST